MALVLLASLTTSQGRESSPVTLRLRGITFGDEWT